MSIATALKHMLAAGMPHDAIIAAVTEMEAAQVSVAPVRKATNDDAVWVYVIGVDHPGSPSLTKVGISQHPKRRMATLEKARGFNLYLAGSFGPFSRRQALEIEKAAHFALHDRQEIGEWFWCSVAEAMATVRASEHEGFSR